MYMYITYIHILLCSWLARYSYVKLLVCICRELSTQLYHVAITDHDQTAQQKNNLVIKIHFSNWIICTFIYTIVTLHIAIHMYTCSNTSLLLYIS